MAANGSSHQLGQFVPSSSERFGVPLLWGVYLDSGHNLVLASDMGSGLWIVRPKGLNHFHELWRSVEDDPAWWCSTQTIADTGIIPHSVVEQELQPGLGVHAAYAGGAGILGAVLFATRDA